MPKTTKSSASPADCAGALLDALPGVMWFVRRQMRTRRAKGMSVPQFRVLVQLKRSPEISLSAVAEVLGCSLPTASRMVSGLVSKGFIVRKTAARDRRQVSLHLTPRGKIALDAAWDGTRASLAEKLADVSPEDRAALLRSLQSLESIFRCSRDAPCSGAVGADELTADRG